MVDTQKRNKRQYEWQKENTDRLNFVMPKGMKSRIIEASEKLDMNASEFIRVAINEKLSRDSL